MYAKKERAGEGVKGREIEQRGKQRKEGNKPTGKRKKKGKEKGWAGRQAGFEG